MCWRALFPAIGHVLLLIRNCRFLKTMTDVIGPDSTAVTFGTSLGSGKSNPIFINLGSSPWRVRLVSPLITIFRCIYTGTHMYSSNVYGLLLLLPDIRLKSIERSLEQNVFSLLI